MNSKVRVGVIGAGHWGPNLIRNFYFNSSSTVLAVADKVAKKRELISQTYPDILVTDDERQVLDHPDIEAVVICTPTATHFDLTRAALESGKHVFVEKPLATKADHCNALVALARKMDKLLFVGHVFVYNAGIQAVKKYIDSGELGDILYFNSQRTNLGPIRTDVSSLWDLAPHDISIFNYWLNERPEIVNAVGGKFLGNHLHDTVFATYRFPSGVLAHAHVSWIDPHKTRQIVVVGEKKMLVWDDLSLMAPITIYDKKAQLHTEEIDEGLADTFLKFRASIHEGDTLMPKIKLNEPLAAECRAFLASIGDRSYCLSTGHDGGSVVRILEATDASLKANGKEMSISYE